MERYRYSPTDGFHERSVRPYNEVTERDASGEIGPSALACYGSVVTLEWEKKYKQIFICDEEDISRHSAREGVDYDFRVSRQSPISATLMGMMIGDEAATGKNNTKFRIVAINQQFT